MNWTIRLVVVGIALAVLIGMVVAQGVGTPSGPKMSPAGMPIEKIKINGESFDAEVAATDATRIKGLGGRTSIGKNEAMLFVFKVSDVQRFWMKDCLMDIDVIYVDREGKITAVHEMKKEAPRGPNESLADYEARLKHYSSEKNALYAIEFAPGTISRLGLKPGQTITLDRLKLNGYAR